MIAAIELGVLEALKDAEPLLGYAWRFLETYPADWDQWLKDKKGLIACPAAWIGFRGWDADVSDGRLRHRAHFWLVVCADSARNEEARRHGHLANPGSYQLLVHAAWVLHNLDFGLPMDGMRVGAARPVALPKAFEAATKSMMAVELSTLVDFGAALEDADIGDFETFHVNWDIPAFGNIAGAPGSAQADASDDATDHVQLETD